MSLKSTGNLPRKNREADQAHSADRVLSPHKKALFGLVGFVLLPLLGLVAVEGFLRLVHAGYRTDFFIQRSIDGKPVWVENDKFGLRFFPAEISRSPAPIVVPMRKNPETFRIFVLGESAAQGDPRPAYGASRYLEALLEQRFPTAKFEVLNTAMTAINSHAILPIARECARLEGDAWIIYMGNNEMVGPFGATTVFGAQSPSARYVRWSLALQRTRLGQFIYSLARRLAGSAPGKSSWAGMSMFLDNRVPPNAPRKEVVYDNYRMNLVDILEQGKVSGVHVLLNTVAVNLADCAPFASDLKIGADPGLREAVEKLITAGAAAEAARDARGATKAYLEATGLDAGWAEAEFRLAALFNTPSNHSAVARDKFQKACDLDALPFRADSRINRIIRESAASLPPSSAFIDTAKLFEGDTGNVPGRESFYEHVHFNFDGNYRLALAWADQIVHWLPPEFQAITNQWADQMACEQRLAITEWNRYGVLQDMIRRLAQPPFTAQANHQQTVDAMRAGARDLRQKMTKQESAQAQEVYGQALARKPDDHRLHESFAEFLEDTGRNKEAAAQWEIVSRLLPHHFRGYFQSGRLLLLAGDLAEARKRLEKTAALRPDLGEAWLLLGQIESLEGHQEKALGLYQRALALTPEDERVHYHIGRALSLLGRKPESMARLREAIRLRPEYWEARYSLGEELAFAGSTREAAAEFESVIQSNPNYPMAYLNLAVARFQQGRREEAVRLLEKTLRLDPKNERAAQYYQKLRPPVAGNPK